MKILRSPSSFIFSGLNLSSNSLMHFSPFYEHNLYFFYFFRNRKPDSKQGRVFPWLEYIILTKTKILSLCLIAALNPLKDDCLKKIINFFKKINTCKIIFWKCWKTANPHPLVLLHIQTITWKAQVFQIPVPFLFYF